MSETHVARDRAPMPAGAGAIVDRRSLANSHRQLASLLKRGMSVLDVGCATGAITADIADEVGPQGISVGTDINQPLLAQGSMRRHSRPQLHFVAADIFDLPFGRIFDIVTAGRVLQWLANPSRALTAMSRVVKPGGVLLVLDYDHEQIDWTPAPPASMQRFYAAFLAWRAAAGFDNAIARRLVRLFEEAGAADVRLTPQPEVTRRGDDDFLIRAGIWADVAATRGYQMVRDGFLSDPERIVAEREYRAWVGADARCMSLQLSAVQGVID